MTNNDNAAAKKIADFKAAMAEVEGQEGVLFTKRPMTDNQVQQVDREVAWQAWSEARPFVDDESRHDWRDSILGGEDDTFIPTQAARIMRERMEASVWTDVSTLPPLNQQVLVELKQGVGTVCDVACYVGKNPDGEDRWILADVQLETKQIKRWAHIYPLPPKDELGLLEAEIARLRAALGFYARDANWRTTTKYMSGRSGQTSVEIDRGSRARQALAGGRDDR